MGSDELSVVCDRLADAADVVHTAGDDLSTAAGTYGGAIDNLATGAAGSATALAARAMATVWGPAIEASTTGLGDLADGLTFSALTYCVTDWDISEGLGGIFD